MLAPFEELKNCPACNEARFGIMNAEKLRKFFYKFHRGTIIDGECVAVKDDESVLEVNHIDVTCSRCSYRWAEQTALQESEYSD